MKFKLFIFLFLKNGILFQKLFWPTVRKKKMFYWSRKTFKTLVHQPQICKIFEITIYRTIHSNSERWVKFLKQNAFLTCSWIFLGSNTWKQFKFKLEKKLWDSEIYRKKIPVVQCVLEYNRVHWDRYGTSYVYVHTYKSNSV